MRLKRREFYMIREVADLLRMTPHGVRNLLADGRLTCVRLRGVRRVLIPAASVNILLGAEKDPDDRRAVY